MQRRLDVLNIGKWRDPAENSIGAADEPLLPIEKGKRRFREENFLVKESATDFLKSSKEIFLEETWLRKIEALTQAISNRSKKILK